MNKYQETNETKNTRNHQLEKTLKIRSNSQRMPLTNVNMQNQLEKKDCEPDIFQIVETSNGMNNKNVNEINKKKIKNDIKVRANEQNIY